MSFRHTPAASAETLVLVADRAQARFFAAEWPRLDPFQEVETLIHPAGRMREHDTVSDGPGRFRTPGGSPTAAEATTDFRHISAAEFARLLIDRVEGARNRNEFGRWLLVAPALLLGEIRKAMPEPLARLLACELEQELVYERPEAIRERLLERLATRAGEA